MGVYLSTPSMEKSSSDGEIPQLAFGASSMQGWRQAQEDAHNCCLKFDDETKTVLFAVYDGHGGADVAEYASRHLPDFIKKNQLYQKNQIPEALQESFIEFDRSLITKSVQEELKSIAGLDKVETADEEEAELLKKESEMSIEEVLDNYGGMKEVPQDVKEVFKRNRKIQKEIADSSTDQSSTDNGKDAKDIVNVKSGKESEKEEHISKEANHNSDHPKENGKVPEVPEPTKDEIMETADEKIEEKSSEAEEKEKVVDDDEGDEDDEEDEEDSDDDEDEEDEGGDGEGEEEAWSDTTSEEEDDEADVVDDDRDMMMGSNCDEESPGYDSGCTAIVVLLRERLMHVANVGDSRCVLCRNGKAIDMSEDHKPENDIELARIKKAGGAVSFDGRVNGGLNLSRALGDHGYKNNETLDLKDQMISGFPDIKSMELEDDDEFLVIACDGIWNSLTSQEVVDYVKERLDNGVETLSDVCNQLFDHCVAPDTSGDGTGCDNMTCIIVRFKKEKGDNGTPAEVARADKETNNRGVKRSVDDTVDGEEKDSNKPAKCAKVEST